MIISWIKRDIKKREVRFLNRQERMDFIHKKGFDMIRNSKDGSPYNNYVKLKMGSKAYDDATIDISLFKR